MARSDPRISVNKLAEYLSASPVRRKTIVREQRDPKPFIVARYTDAERTIADAICAGSLRPVTDAMASLEERANGSDFAAETAQLCWEALSSFAELWEEGKLDLDGLTLRKGDKGASKLDVSGVAVSVRPEVLVSGKARGEPVCGAVKLSLSKTNPLDAKAGAYAATILRTFTETYHRDGHVQDDLIFVVDVFSQQVFTAPKSYRRRLADVEAACEEIALRWGKP